jgi:hypothetical protein
MKIFLAPLLSCVLVFAASSCSDEKQISQTTPTPNQSLKADAERLQQATANAAKQREKAAQTTPSPTASQP